MARKDASQIPGLRFRVEDLVSETECMLSIGDRFIHTGSLWVLPRYKEKLENITSSRRGVASKITLDALQTELADIRGRKVYARISGNWQVTPLSQRAKKSTYSRIIAFSGIASTVIELFQYGMDKRVAMWRMEVGSEGAPGSFFHVQILGDSGDPPFPKTIEIPRLPSLFATPMSALSYTFGELFGNVWAESIASGGSHGSRWCNFQRHLLSRQLEWYSQIIKRSDSPNWMSIKQSIPPYDLFL